MTVTAAPVGPQQYTEWYEPTAESVTKARRDVRLILDVWGLDTLTEVASLVVTELATNAIQHCPFRSSKIKVAVLRTTCKTVEVQVWDSCPTKIEPREASPTDEDGRGLLLVESMSSRWGVKPLPGGKCVWAEMTL